MATAPWRARGLENVGGVVFGKGDHRILLFPQGTYSQAFPFLKFWPK